MHQEIYFYDNNRLMINPSQITQDIVFRVWALTLDDPSICETPYQSAGVWVFSPILIPVSCWCTPWEPTGDDLCICVLAICLHSGSRSLFQLDPGPLNESMEHRSPMLPLSHSLPLSNKCVKCPCFPRKAMLLAWLIPSPSNLNFPVQHSCTSAPSYYKAFLYAHNLQDLNHFPGSKPVTDKALSLLKRPFSQGVIATGGTPSSL